MLVEREPVGEVFRLSGVILVVDACVCSYCNTKYISRSQRFSFRWCLPSVFRNSPGYLLCVMEYQEREEKGVEEQLNRSVEGEGGEDVSCGWVLGVKWSRKDRVIGFRQGARGCWLHSCVIKDTRRPLAVRCP